MIFGQDSWDYTSLSQGRYQGSFFPCPNFLFKKEKKQEQSDSLVRNFNCKTKLFKRKIYFAFFLYSGKNKQVLSESTMLFGRHFQTSSKFSVWKNKHSQNSLSRDTPKRSIRWAPCITHIWKILNWIYFLPTVICGFYSELHKGKYDKVKIWHSVLNMIWMLTNI